MDKRENCHLKDINCIKPINAASKASSADATSSLLIMSSLYLANIFALYISCQLSLVSLFMRSEYFMLVTWWRQYSFHTISSTALSVQKRPFPVFTRYRTNSKPFRFKTRPDFFGCPIRTANRTWIRPVPWVPCKRKAESYRLVNGSEFVRTRVNVVLVEICIFSLFTFQETVGSHLKQ